MTRILLVVRTVVFVLVLSLVLAGCPKNGDKGDDGGYMATPTSTGSTAVA